MKLIVRHYLKEFLKTFLIVTVGVSFIFSIIGLIDKMGEFMNYNPQKILLILYILYGLPIYMGFLLPVGALFSSLFVFSQAMQRLEIIALKSSGAKMKDLLKPFIVLGMIITMIGFINSEIIMPKCFKELNSLKNQIINKTTKYTFKEGALFMRGKDGTVIKIDLYLPDQKICHGVTIFKIDNDGLVEKISSPKGIWTKEGWLLKDLTIVNLRNSTNIKKEELLVKEMDSPEIFQSEIYKAEEMTLPELLKYKERLNNAGFKNMKLLVDISSRITYSFVNLIMLILGFSLTLSGGTLTSILFKNQSTHSATQNNIITAGIGVLITIFYWLSYSFFLSLGYAGALNPFIAPLITPLIFSMLTIFLYKSIQE